MAKRFKSSGIAPLLILFVFIMTLATRLFNLTSGSSVDEIFMKTIVAQIVIFALPALFYIRTRDDKYFSNINVSAMIPSKTLFLIYTLGVLVIGSMLIQFVVYALGGQEYAVSTTGQELSAISETSGFSYVFLALCLVPAICEEFVFRGILLYEYSGYGKFCAITLSSLAFAMLHFDTNGFLSYFFCGIVLGSAYYITQNLFITILLHLANNLFSIYAIPLVSQMILGSGSMLFSLFILISLFLLTLTLALREASIIYWEYSVGDALMKKNEKEQKGRTRGIYAITEVFLSPVFLICALLFTVMSIFVF
ncbi:MAG: CPBP family intramembrane metalloprotease [Clostridia bacterium]|nr:CPBP family intramembrane metalloprotease [Clostridia bacterium]MBQ2251509.1 CPBP family intramembrane metalloprotease [Clostridia bacterium]